MAHICAWCRNEFGTALVPGSHGCCPACIAAVEADYLSDAPSPAPVEATPAERAPVDPWLANHPISTRDRA